MSSASSTSALSLHTNDIYSEDALDPELKLCEPDLTVKVGGTTESSPAVLRMYYSTVMASQSAYIDTMLSTPPIKESGTYEISFPDIPAKTWGLMMKFLCPHNALDMSVQDTFNVAVFYDKYGFVEGRLLCNTILLRFFQSLGNQEKTCVLDIDELVKALEVSFDANLKDAWKLGVDYLANRLTGFVDGELFGPTMFELRHMKILHRLIIHLLEREVDDNFRYSLHPSGYFEKEEIVSDVFPRLYVTEWKLEKSQRLARDVLHHLLVSNIKINGSSVFSDSLKLKFCLAGDSFVICGSNSFSMKPISVPVSTFSCEISIKRTKGNDGSDGNWVISAENKEQNKVFVLWEAPYSSNFTMPPKKWKPVHPSASGIPNIELIYGAPEEIATPLARNSNTNSSTARPPSFFASSPFGRNSDDQTPRQLGPPFGY